MGIHRLEAAEYREEKSHKKSKEWCARVRLGRKKEIECHCRQCWPPCKGNIRIGGSRTSVVAAPSVVV